MVKKEPGNSYLVDIWSCRDYMGTLWEMIYNNQRGCHDSLILVNNHLASYLPLPYSPLL